VSRRALWWAVSLGGVAVWFLLASWTSSAGDPVVCLFRRTLELPCPGCGLTRAFSHLARGDLQGAVAFHPLAPVLLLEAFAGWGVWGLSINGWWPDKLGGLVEHRAGLWIVATGVLFLALWLGRLAVGDLSAL